MPNDVVKRVHYFDGQFLTEADFNDEQAYHLDRQRRHHSLLHTPGIASGLKVNAEAAAAQAEVEPGTGVDAEGRQIVLDEKQTLALGSLAGKTVLVVISYGEELSDPATTAGAGLETRWRERPVVEAVPEAGAPSASTHLRLARLVIGTDGRVQTHETTVRAFAGAQLGRELTVEKLTLSRPGVDSAQWPSLTCGAPVQVDVGGSLRVRNGLDVRALDCILQVRSSIPVLVKGRGNGGAIYFGVDNNNDPNEATAAIETSWGEGGPPYLPQLGIGITRDFSAGPRANILMDYNGNIDLRQGTTSRLFVQAGGGRVGIGTKEPVTPLTVTGEEGLVTVFGSGLDGVRDIYQRFVLYADTKNGLLFDAPKDAAGKKLNIEFNWRGGGTPPLIISGGTGKVGIGTREPIEQLDVVGNMRLSGTLLQAEWITPPTLESGWLPFSAEYNSPGYFKDSMGIVHLRGVAKSGSGLIFYLPPDCRPEKRHAFAVITDPNTIGRIDVLPLPPPRLEPAKRRWGVEMISGSNQWISLDGITFRAAPLGIDPGDPRDPTEVRRPTARKPAARKPAPGKPATRGKGKGPREHAPRTRR